MSSYPSRHAIRLREYDYALPGAYFVTLCTEQRLCLFGSIENADMELSPAGQMVSRVWANLGSQYAGVTVDEYVVMPNHLHGILILTDGDETDSQGTTTPAPGLSVSSIVKRFKTFTMHQYGQGVRAQGWPRYPGQLWQHRFHDHVIRNERALAAIREYIANNARQWQLDRENPESTARG